jgi:hypothetical protein
LLRTILLVGDRAKIGDGGDLIFERMFNYVRKVGGTETQFVSNDIILKSNTMQVLLIFLLFFI